VVQGLGIQPLDPREVKVELPFSQMLRRIVDQAEVVVVVLKLNRISPVVLEALA
jgi:hypothetical protein